MRSKKFRSTTPSWFSKQLYNASLYATATIMEHCVGWKIGEIYFRRLSKDNRISVLWLNMMLLHSTLVWQLLIIGHKIDRHGRHSRKRQRPLDDDDDG